jgi:GrpB-like predicted nucleotidyltransferase (UPF0157 family)
VKPPPHSEGARRDPIQVAPYDTAWPDLFDEERDSLETAMGPSLVMPLQHIGSTAVPGLHAKPIIDMLAVVKAVDEIDDQAVSACGWILARQPGDEEERRLSYCKPSIEHRTHHLHVVEEDSTPWRDWILFRDHLRLHPQTAAEYADLKRQLAARYGDNPNERSVYRDGKSTFVSSVVRAARNIGGKEVSPVDGLKLKRAFGTDRENVLEILDEAASWLGSAGVQQWTSPFPRAVVDRDFEHNTVWLATLDGYCIATASTLTRDPMFWGDVGGDAWYLHRFAVRRLFAGLGRPVLALIEREAARCGVPCVRLDCGVGLQGYYEAAGYERRSSVSLVSATSAPPRSLWFCYEKSLPEPGTGSEPSAL